MKEIKPSTGHIKVLHALSEEYDVNTAIRVLASTVRFTAQEREMLLDVKTCARTTSESLTMRIEGTGMVTRTNIGCPSVCKPTHHVLTEFGLVCGRCIELMNTHSVPPLVLDHNNQMVEFLNELKEVVNERT